MIKTWVLGPCAVQDKYYLDIGIKLSKIMQGRDFYYKASFDKANRSSAAGLRGEGLERSLELFRDIKEKIPGIKLCTDVHLPCQVEKIAGIIDLVQVPAFLQFQSDLIYECCKYFDNILIKKMQHASPKKVIASIDKVRSANPKCNVVICERGTNLGYEKLIVDFSTVDEFKQHFDGVCMDACHSAQRSRSIYGNQADRKICERYFVTTPIFGYNWSFAEVHSSPIDSVSDKDSQLYLDTFEQLLHAQDEADKISWI